MSQSVASPTAPSPIPSTSNDQTDLLKSLGSLFKQCELKHSAPALQPRGLSNRNNWCYVNATLQALLACPPFYNLLKNVYAKLKAGGLGTLTQVPFVACLGRFISEFKVMVRNQPENNNAKTPQQSSSFSKDLVMGDPFECEYVYDALSRSQTQSTDFRPGRQEDAQEFLSFLLNRVHEEMVKCLESLNPAEAQHEGDYTRVNGKPPPPLSGGKLTNGHAENTELVNGSEVDADDEWHEVGRKNKAFVTRKVCKTPTPVKPL